MKRRRAQIRMTALVFTLSLLFAPLPAAASVIFDWTGTCLTGCQGQATFHVETTDAYTPGVDLAGNQGFAGLPVVPTTILTARYTDSTFSVDLAVGPIDFRLLLPATDPSPAPATSSSLRRTSRQTRSGSGACMARSPRFRAASRTSSRTRFWGSVGSRPQALGACG